MRIWRFSCVLGSVLMALALIGNESAFAANHPSSQSMGQWQKEIAGLRTPGHGCYHASYPLLQWQATRCLAAPDVPLAPRLHTLGGPLLIGNGADYSAQVTGTISKATGTFTHLSSGLTETGQIGGVGGQIKNAFTLQLNSEFFSTPVCSGSANPSKCLGWQQFVYAFHYAGTTNEVFMQYWLLYWDTTCPAGWATYQTGGYTFCYTNSPASAFGSLPASSLGHATFAGQAASGGNDQVSLTNTATGKASSASNGDSVLHLSTAWNTAEWGVFGDAGGGEANFGAGATLEAVTTLQGTSSSPPKCVAEGFTGETNNLSFTRTGALGTVSSPTMATKQTDGTTTTPSCRVGG